MRTAAVCCGLEREVEAADVVGVGVDLRVVGCERPAVHDSQPPLLVEPRLDHHIDQPTSSSSNRNWTPLAVPGRCRQTISPAIWTVTRRGDVSTLARGHVRGRQPRPQQPERVIARRRARAPRNRPPSAPTRPSAGARPCPARRERQRELPAVLVRGCFLPRPKRFEGMNSPSCQSASRRPSPKRSNAPTAIRFSIASGLIGQRRMKSASERNGPLASRSSTIRRAASPRRAPRT